MSSQESSRNSWWLLSVSLVAAVGFGVFLAFQGVVPPVGPNLQAEEPKAKAKKEEPEDKLEKAPELEGGTAWLNTGKPITMKDLKGKIVLLDFWTLCCINCIHTLPDLAKLEKKYENELVVIGVHSAKFENEKNSESIRKALLRYEIKHPVVNDSEMKIWDSFGVRSWPTLALIDPEGNFLGAVSGEGRHDLLDRVIAKQIEIHRKKKTLDEKPIRFDTAKFRDQGDTPLYFPGKVLADEAGKRLFIADSTHHRIVITDLQGTKIDVVGSGNPGFKDGTFEQAMFDDPQGMVLDGDTLFVADRKNHSIRALDLKAKTVKLAAGTGKQDRGERGEGGPALERGLNSPWDLCIVDGLMYIAMAGHHQIWTFDRKQNRVEPYAGDGGENLKDGPLDSARFAQPSGITSDGKNLYTADCEVSAVRKVPLGGKGRVTTLVGTGLFDFGDRDGPGKSDDKEKRALLQHAIGVLYLEGKVYVADTYNSKIKVIDLEGKSVNTFVGGEKGKPLFNEPAGLSYAAGKIYVADTNAHRIQVIDVKTQAVSTLELKGVPLVVQKAEKKPEEKK